MSRLLSGLNYILYSLKIAHKVGFKNYTESIRSKNDGLLPPRGYSNVQRIGSMGVASCSEKVDFSAIRKHESIRKAIGYIIPGIKKLITMDIEKEEFHIFGRKFHEPKFSKAVGKVVFSSISIMKIPERQFMLISVETEQQSKALINKSVMLNIISANHNSKFQPAEVLNVH